MEHASDKKLEQAKKLAILFLHMPITPTEFSPIVVAHPIFESAFLPDMDSRGIFNALEDSEKLMQYEKQLEKKINSFTEISDILYFIRKSYRLTFLHHANFLSDKEKGNLLAEQWTVIENINNDINVSKAEINRWLNAADKSRFMEEEDRAVYDNLPDIVSVYRGCQTQSGVDGFSWTLDKNIATWFANRFEPKTAYLCEAQISKNNIIAYTDSRSEKEVIVNRKELKNQIKAGTIKISLCR